LGSSLTIKNRIQALNFLNFGDDIFKNHLGVPEAIVKELPADRPNDRHYMPPIIAISIDNTGSQLMSSALASLLGSSNLRTFIEMNGVIFDNNNGIYDLENYTPMDERALYLIKQTMSRKLNLYRSGYVKMTAGFETLDSNEFNFLVEQNYLGTVPASLLFRNGRISNNRLLSSGCLFPTLFMESYFVDNVTIINNEISPNSQPFEEKQGYLPTSFLSTPMTGMFCLYYDDSLTLVSLIQLIVSNSVAKNNTGTLFYMIDDPIGVTYFSLMNSVFIQNECKYASLIVALKFLTVNSINNTFIGNKNVFGIAMAHPFAQYVGTMNRYIGNDGVYASIVLIHSGLYAESFECAGKAYNNTVSPKYKVSMGLMAQGSLYCALMSPFIFVDYDFRYNRAYSGVVTSYGGAMKFYNCKVTESKVFGMSVFGTLVVASQLTIVNSEISKNLLIIDNSVSSASKAVMSLHNIRLQMTNFTFENNVIEGQGFLLFCNTVKAVFQNVSLLNTHKMQEDQGSLCLFILSQVNMSSLSCNNITSLFTLTQTLLRLDAVAIQDLQAQNNIQFLVSMYNSSFIARDFNYNNRIDIVAGNQFPLLEGIHATISLDKARFSEPGRRHGTIFSLANDGQLSIMRSVFSFAEQADVLVMKIESVEGVSIQNCIFRSFGTLLKATDIKLGLLFVSNTVFTISQAQDLILQDIAVNYIVDNYFVPEMIPAEETLISASIQILDSSGKNLLQNNIFFSLYGLNGIVEIGNENSPYKIDFTDNQFISNIASRGGALYLSGDTEIDVSSALITRNLFIGNQARKTESGGIQSGRGGVLYLTSVKQTPQETRISNCLFVKNTAETRGGAIYFDFSIPQFEDNIFEENFAGSQENHIGSYPIRLVNVGPADLDKRNVYVPSNKSISFVQGNEKQLWFNLSSGSNVVENYFFMLLDMFNQTIDDDNSSFLELHPEEISEQAKKSFSNKLSVQAKKGVYNLKNFILTYMPNSSLTVSLKSTAISKFKGQPPIQDLAILPSIETQVYFRPCYSYEVEVNDSNSLVTCQPCQAGFWQVSPFGAKPTCAECDQESTYCFGGPQVGPKEGYWRMNETADLVLECPRKEACKGNLVTKESDKEELDPVGRCSDGYEGNLCNKCRKGWAKTPNEECVNCDENANYYLRLLGALAFQAFIILNSIRGAFEFGSKYTKRDQMRINGAVLSRILTNYLQLLSLVGAFPVNWTRFLKEFFSTTSSLSSVSEQAFAMDCTFVLLGLDQIQPNTAMLKTIMVSVFPAFLITIGIFILLIYSLYIRTNILSREFRSRTITIIVVICFNMQLNALKRNFLLLQCRNLYRIDTQQKFSTQDYDLECWTGKHYSWALTLILPSLVTWGVVLPGLMFFVLIKNRHKLHQINIANKFAFLYAGYKSEKYHWEFVIMIRKFALLTLFAFNDPNSIYMQVYFSVIIIVFSYILQIVYSPYSEDELNSLEKVGLFSSMMLGICSLYFTNTDRDVKMDIFMVTLSLVGISWFIVKFGILFIKTLLYVLRHNSKALSVLRQIEKLWRYCLALKRKVAGIEGGRLTDVDIELVKQTTGIPTFQESPKRHLKTDEFFSNSPTSSSRLKNSPNFLRSSTIHLNKVAENPNNVQDSKKSKSVPKEHFYKGFFQENLEEEEEEEVNEEELKQSELKTKNGENEKSKSLKDLFEIIDEEPHESSLFSLGFEIQSLDHKDDQQIALPLPNDFKKMTTVTKKK